MPDPLAHLAMLYAAGELTDAETVAFEARLAEEPAARDALVHAVHLSALLNGTPDRPDPTYRSAVRARLRHTPHHRTAIRWLGLAVAAAACLLLAPGQPPVPDTAEPLPGVSVVPIVVAPVIPSSELVELPIEPAGDRAITDEAMAELWADLSNTDHLRQAHEEQQRFRSRSEDRPGSRLATLRPGRPGAAVANEGTE